MISDHEPEYDLTILIPVFNEEENLKRVNNVMQEYLKRAMVKARVLFINDGSTDRSLEMIRRMAASIPEFGFISLEQNSGLSAALKAGIDHVETRLTGYIDADLQTTPEDFNLLLEYADQYEMVLGIRSQRKDSIIKLFSSKFANGYRKLFTRDGVTDTGCPLKIVHSDFAKRIPFFKGMHRFLPALIQLQGGHIKEVPVRHFPRVAGKAKYHMYNRIIGPFFDCWAFVWMRRKYIRYQIAEQG